ncbi:hypothetical protein OAW28_02355 [Alphaproteobacteria bacterium]|nr:hypothetical protein [Alphaproteobacteria bacterium]
MIIRLATLNDSYHIQKFISENWKSDHILATNDDFFNYLMCTDKVPNFVIAEENNIIFGVLGFIEYSPDNSSGDVFLALLRALKHPAQKNIGLKLIRFISEHYKQNINVVGVNLNILQYYQFLNFYTGYLHHYFWLNSDSPNFRKYCLEGSKNKNPQHNIYRLNNLQFEPLNNQLVLENKLLVQFQSNAGFKSPTFIYHRYINHPKYKYQLFTLLDEKNKQCGIGVIRLAYPFGTPAIKIIDWIGDIKFLPHFCNFVIFKAIEMNADYVDLYCSGVEDDHIFTSGLSKININTIIPNYLEPLIMKNIDIAFASSTQANPIFFRGDGDQDRPSI